jgi:hypothetical protein
MPTCEFCGKEYSGQGDTVDLYRTKLVDKSIETDKKSPLGTTTVYKTFDEFEPVKIMVCKRHQKDLWMQRIIPGLILFLFIYLPIQFLVSYPISALNAPTASIFIVAFIISLGLTIFIVTKLVQFDSLIARAMTIQERAADSGVEYMTVKKYHRITRRVTTHPDMPEEQPRKDRNHG